MLFFFRAVHGGAIATIFDSAGGVLAYQLGYRCVTVNLNVNFHGQVHFLSVKFCLKFDKRLLLNHVLNLGRVCKQAVFYMK